MAERITVVGARGFIGSAVAAAARAQSKDVVECTHDAVPSDVELGTLVYCSGFAWGAERDPFNAYRVHAVDVANILERARYAQAIYISSTRVYDRANESDESADTPVRAGARADVYAASKLAGEGIVLAAREENRVVRCSNVYGESLRSELFLSDILRQAAKTGRISIRSSLRSAKDYVSVVDVADCVLRIAGGSRERIYNVAAGRNTTHGALLDRLHSVVPFELEIAPQSPDVVVREIDVRRIQDEFAFEARDVLDDLPRLAEAFRAGRV